MVYEGGHLDRLNYKILSTLGVGQPFQGQCPVLLDPHTVRWIGLIMCRTDQARLKPVKRGGCGEHEGRVSRAWKGKKKSEKSLDAKSCPFPDLNINLLQTTELVVGGGRNLAQVLHTKQTCLSLSLLFVLRNSCLN